MWASAPPVRSIISHTAHKVFGPKISSRVQLVGAQVAHRHGDRTPINKVGGMDAFWREKIPEKAGATLRDLDIRFPLVGVADGDLHNFDGIRGRLTHRGLLQLKQVGQQLKDDYERIHGAPLKPERTQVHSTQFLRTVQSVQSLLDGLFDTAAHPGADKGGDAAEPAAGGAGASRLVKQIEPLNHMDPFAVLRKTPVATARMREIQQSAESVQFEKRVADFMHTVLAQYHAAGILDPELHQPGKMNWLDVLEVTICLNCYGKLPEAHSGIMGDLMTVAINRWRSLFSDVALSRMVSGELLQTLHARIEHSVQEDLVARQQGTPFSPHVTIYSSHDSSLYSLLHALNNELGDRVWNEDGTHHARLTDIIDFEGEVPPYASTVAIACWRDLDFGSSSNAGHALAELAGRPASPGSDVLGLLPEEYCVEVYFNGQSAFVTKSVFDAVPQSLLAGEQ